MAQRVEPRWAKVLPALPLLLLVVGAALVVVGVALLWWRVAPLVAGLLALAGGIDMSRTPRQRP
jgi:hypothetical protein